MDFVKIKSTTSPLASIVIREQAGNSIASTITHTLSHDRRDSRIFPNIRLYG